MDVEDLDGHATGTRFGVWLKEAWLVGVAGDDRVGAMVREETLG